MLAEVLSLDLYAFLVVFARVGAAIMVLPVFSGKFMTQRSRTGLALLISLIILPLVGPKIPALPDSTFVLLGLLFGEIVIGVFMGMIAQFIMAALHTAGTVISLQTGMANAMVDDAVSAGQAAVMASFLSNVAILLILATNLHHLMLLAVVDSYEVFTPGAALPVGDLSHMAARLLSDGFTLGAQLAAPAIAFSLILQTSMGLLNRLIQQLPVFFVMLPIQQMVGLMLVAAALPPMMLWFMKHLREGYLPFVGGGG